MPTVPVRLLFAALALTSIAAAQVPAGFGVCASTNSPDAALTVFSPRSAGPAVRITGVPDELRLTIGVSNGANSVAILPDGRLAVGNLAGREGRPVVIHVLRLNGLSVVATDRYQVGTSLGSGGTVNQIRTLPDGRAVFVTSSLRTGIQIGVLDPVAGTVTALPITAVPAEGLNAVAASPDGTQLYFGRFLSVTAGTIYTAPLAGGTASVVTNTPFGIVGLDTDDRGQLWVAMNNATSGLGVVDLATSSLRAISGTPRNLNEVAVERATGNVVFLTAATPNSGRSAELYAGTTPTATIATFSSGILAGLDLAESPSTYGHGTPGANTYRFRHRPHPGGLPLRGNLGFSVTIDSAPGVADASLLLLGPAAAQQTLLGVELLVDPASLSILGIPSGRSVTVPLPLPADPALDGVTLFAQSVHAEGTTLASSDGIRFTVVRP